jgi:hypothetical protein
MDQPIRFIVSEPLKQTTAIFHAVGGENIKRILVMSSLLLSDGRRALTSGGRKLL